MPKKLQELSEVFVSTPETAVAISRAVNQGKLRKIASRLYTKNLTEAPEQIVRRHLWQIVSDYMPGALVADRTAIENAPAADGSVFLIAERKRDIALPGVVIKPRQGALPLDTDRPFIGSLRLSSMARAYLENMSSSRARAGAISRTLNQVEIEGRLDALLRRGGVEALNHLRDEARSIAIQLNLEDNFKKLDKLIGALLGTRTAKLETPQGIARSHKMPFDPDRIKLFRALHNELRSWPPIIRLTKVSQPANKATRAFFESYFSNFIEGTEFEVEEAVAIIFNGKIPSERPQDAHDIIGTYRLVSDDGEIKKTPRDFLSFIDLLRNRHFAIMESRPDKLPGQFKVKGNRAGATTFVAPDLVEGTLKQGFELYQSLENPFARAVFMMFFVSEVHPFADGNGRVARVMMNAELASADEERIIIPTIYRANYLASLKALSQSGHAEPLIRTLDFAQKWVAAIDWRDVQAAQAILQSCNAFLDPAVADAQGIRLKLPG